MAPNETDKFPHILLKDTAQTEPYTPIPSHGKTFKLPPRNRQEHGRKLLRQFEQLRHESDKPTWLVVELKRNQTSDQTVGQLLRYIGWVKRHLADTGDEVYGMIISRQVDDALRYALVTVPNVEFRLYEVEFHLKKSEIF